MRRREGRKRREGREGRQWGWLPWATALALGVGCAPGVAAQERVIDDFESTAAWSTLASDGVTVSIRGDSGHVGRGMRVDFDFHGGAGYAVVRRPLAVELPDNYQFVYELRGAAPRNNVEFKLADSTGENVWWLNRRGVDLRRPWSRMVVRKREISFAWGPAGGGELRRPKSIEIAITAGDGGKGTIWLDDLRLVTLEAPSMAPLAPRATARGSEGASDPARAVDGDKATSWRAAPAGAVLSLDLGGRREYGGLVLDWDVADYATAYTLDASSDGTVWETVARVTAGNGGRDYLPVPDGEARWLRLTVQRTSRGRGAALREATVQPLAFSASANALFTRVAADAPAGRYPRFFSGEQVYWTVVGADGDTDEALLDEDGAVEFRKGGASLEPFIRLGGHLRSWHDATRSASLQDGALPVPSVRWTLPELTLDITVAADGPAGRSVAWVRYRVSNTSRDTLRPTLALALRPFQAYPPWQFLNVEGGAARVATIGWNGQTLRADSVELFPFTRPARAGATAFESGEIVEHLARGAVPAAVNVRDRLGFASAALEYPMVLPPGATRNVWIAVPFHAVPPDLRAAMTGRGAAHVGDKAMERTISTWRARLGVPAPTQPTREAAWTLNLPPAAQDIVRTIRSTLAYILINRDGPRLQPGSGAYERSWVRDGALTSAALLRFGFTAEARAFIEWFAPYQYPSGKVPCCVDHRGADPVEEHDSHGELIYAVAEYFRFTHDTAFVRQLWPHVTAAARYIDQLRQQRRTAEYRTPERREFFGLLPPSISHEGYSAKPMHSYWDDFFALRGLKDAAMLAGVAGDTARAAQLAHSRDEFAHDLGASVRAAIARHGIDVIPGSADLGDFDATSTTVALEPAEAWDLLPEPEGVNTFDRYYAGLERRWNGTDTSAAYTPYEWRTVGAFVRLGQRDRAAAALDGFMRDRRPLGWNEWAEVVWRDPKTPKFIGDMPHTWVGSDFLRSVRDMLVYERERDSSLVLGAGVTRAWLAAPGGVGVSRLPTWYGPVSYRMWEEGGAIRVTIDAGTRMPPGGIVVRAPTADGAEVTVRALPADLTLPK